ncbi:MAG: hypothetical protein HYU69_15090 [Bacteroidetes bacterium]|nr:hypothetical protein [Bacteroidota bacterium]
MKSTPNIRPETFWDTDFSKINFDKQYQSVITRVFNYGTMKDVIEVLKYYKADFVKDILVNTENNLHYNAIDLAKAIFQLKDSDFKCSRSPLFQQSYTKH